MTKVNVSKFGDIINERPNGMSYEEYRAKRKEMCKNLRGYNVIIPNVGKRHIMGRLEGILIPAENWTNSRDVVVVIG